MTNIGRIKIILEILMNPSYYEMKAKEKFPVRYDCYGGVKGWLLSDGSILDFSDLDHRKINRIDGLNMEIALKIGMIRIGDWSNDYSFEMYKKPTLKQLQIMEDIIYSLVEEGFVSNIGIEMSDNGENETYIELSDYDNSIEDLVETIRRFY